MKKGNVIFIMRNGIVDTDTIFVTTNDIKADAHFDNLAEELLKDDYQYILGIEIDYSEKINKLNNYIKETGVSVEWFCDIEIIK